MTYSEFTLDTVRKRLGLTLNWERLFPDAPVLAVPRWLEEAIENGKPLAVGSEKAKSEFLVAPILLTSRGLSNNSFSIYSGYRLDVDPALGLVGECDFILGKSLPVPVIQAPIMAIVEAKRGDIEAGLGQCAAQMVGARAFNQRDGTDVSVIFGCVTTGEDWQFLKLEDGSVSIDSMRYYILQLGEILGVFKTISDRFMPR